MLPRNPQIAHLRPRADNVPASRTAEDPRRALVRLLAELIVEDYLAEQQTGQMQQEEKREEE